MSHSKPKFEGPVRPVCPVCGRTTYSAGGIHPQCAVSRADKAMPPAKDNVRKTKRLMQWTKACPHCKRQLHVRRFVCDCGYAFPAKKAE